MMQDISGRKVGVKYAPERPADVKHCKAKTEKVFNQLGFKINVNLEQGLVEYLDWFEKNCV